MNAKLQKLSVMLCLLFVVNAVYSQKLNETFETEIPKGWQVIDGNSDAKTLEWQGAEVLDGRTKYVGGKLLKNEFLITPKVTVTDTDKELSFYSMTKDYYDYNMLTVYAVENIPQDNNYSGATKILDKKDLGHHTSWKKFTCDLSSVVGKNVYIVFNVTNDFGNVNNYCGIDDVVGPKLYVEAKPTIKMQVGTFADVEVNSSSTAKLKVSNKGTAPLIVTNITVATPFSVKDADKSFTLATNASKEIEITFSPTEAKDYKEVLALTVNGSYLGTNTIALNAKGLMNKPQIEMSITNFAPTLVGSKNTATLTLKNMGNSDLNVSSIDVPTPFSCESTPFSIAAGGQKDLTVTFSPMQSGVFNETLTANITGNYSGTNTIALKARTYVPDFLIEDFETEQFPPLGWTLKNHGSIYYTWERTTVASSVYQGKASAYAGRDGGILSTPKLKIKSGDKLSFYAFHSANKKGPLTIKYSNDNKVWNDLKIITLTDNYQKKEVDLSSIIGEYYIGFDAKEYVYVDNISGPEMLLTSVPNASANPHPENNAQGQNNILELRWDKVLGADGYKIKLGTESNPVEIFDAKELGVEANLKVYGLKFATKYKWQIIPNNNGVDAKNCPIWEFTTMPDPTIKNFPFFAGFEENESTIGWIHKNWYSGGSPYSGKLSARATAQNKLAILMTPPINLPANYNLDFYWKNADIPSGAKVANHDTTFFELSKDFGQTWTILRTLSPTQAMKDYRHEMVNLSSYAGDNVYLRWRYVSDGNIHKAYGVALDHVVIKERPKNPIAKLNAFEWNADTVKFDSVKHSTDIFELINLGVGTLKITEAKFSQERFLTNLNVAEVALNEGDTLRFGFTYKADVAGVHDVIYTIKCNNGEVLKIKLKGKTYPKQFELWDAENMEDFSIQPKPWRTINADSLPTWEWSSFDFPHEGDSLGFIVFNPSACGVENDIKPYSGKKFFASIAAKAEGGKPTNNDDWLISPHIKAKEHTEFTFYARTYTNQTGLLEKFNVAVSTTGYLPKDFTIISGTSQPIEAPYGEYKKYSFDLSSYKDKEIYVAIQCVSFNNHIFMVDDLCLYDFDKVNDAPIFTSKPPKKVIEQRIYSYRIEAEDSNFDTLKFTAKKIPNWLKLTDNKDGTATLVGLAKKEHLGKHQVEIKVSDKSLSTMQVFEIEVMPFYNNKPEFVSIPIAKAKRAMKYTYIVKVRDADKDTIKLELLTNELEWLQLNKTDTVANQWVLSGMPKKTGKYQVSLLANDGFDTVKQVFKINVNEPIFKSPNNLKAKGNKEKVELVWKNTNRIKINEGFEGEWLMENWSVMQSKTIDGELQKTQKGENTWFQADKNSFGGEIPRIIYSGKKSAAISNTAKDFNWLISPKINIDDDSKLSFNLFYVNKTYQNIYRYTNFRVIIITQNQEKKEILFLSKGAKINIYQKPIVISLAEYANTFVRVAFVYEYTNNVYPLLIDNVQISTKQKEETDSDGKHIGYKIYRNSELLKTINDISTLNYLDSSLAKGTYEYYVTALYSNPDGESKASNKEKVTLTSVPNILLNNNIKVYPNPTSSQFTIEMNTQIKSTTTIQIYNMNGQSIYKNSYNKELRKITIDISKYGKGVYMLKMINNDEIINKKIIVK